MAKAEIEVWDDDEDYGWAYTLRVNGVLVKEDPGGWTSEANAIADAKVVLSEYLRRDS